jgi:hypothetical protein
LVTEVVGDELERGQAERAFEDLVVERDEADLGGEVAGDGEEPCVVLHERLIEEMAKPVRDMRPRSLDMRRDDLRLCDHLVLEADIELHVARLVDC